MDEVNIAQYCCDSRLERETNTTSGTTRIPIDEAGLSNMHTRSFTSQPRPRRSRRSNLSTSTSLCALLVCSASLANAQDCIPLRDSTACPAFNSASISTNRDLTGLFPFLSSVTDTSSFDSGLTSYIAGGFTELRFQDLIGCSNVNLDNTTAFYARYTTSVLCNAIVQNSIDACGLTGDATTPLCANSCADYAESEQEIVASDVCGNAGNNALTQVRADFTNCALPARAITGDCIEGSANEQNDCGYSNNLGGLCSYCSMSSPNATDSCCVFSKTTERCEGVVLPVIATASLQPLTTTVTATGTQAAASATGGAPKDHKSNRLSGGAIAGIVIGSIFGIAALLALVTLGCLAVRRRKQASPATSVFNQPYQGRAPSPEYHDGAGEMSERGGGGLPVLGGGRVARMAALEDARADGRPAYLASGYATTSESDPSPNSRPQGPKRSGSLSGARAMMLPGGNNPINNNETSPSSGGEYTSPESHGQSEQLDFFKDYYSQDEIRPGNLVSTLWAYEPRAADEFALERGDMVKVLGIWDDGWATGTRVRQRAAEWKPDGEIQRDSGLSSSHGKRKTLDEGEVKAFPLVCICLPQHWAKTIEGDSTEEGPVFGDR
ncbi:unnamed protein product [Zymoseptoria tritici ST99CH_3D7]|uniref:SH3 domain-containing protein n=1 Tax=Zymoseptoria tritici (strain ST99CH_3D7) TaxID=1276538 RepID=A0A1X7S3I9_ZYMT9|nr:unnamed protein product [Zymoseptoria tritici ST99CH_3D7]